MWSPKFELETHASQAAHSHTIHSEFKTISSYLFSPKILACSSPSRPEHIGHRGREGITLDTLQGSATPLHRIIPHWLLTLTALGLPTWLRHQVQVSVSLCQSEGPICGSAFSFSRLEGDPGITSGMRTSWFQEPLQAAEPGSRNPLPNRAWQSDLAGVSKM
jgi:hypothetical protein